MSLSCFDGSNRDEGNKPLSELFTVVVLSYNNSQYIEGCLDSVLLQTYPEIEIIIADDCSKEFDADRYKAYCEKNNKGNINNVIVIRN